MPRVVYVLSDAIEDIDKPFSRACERSMDILPVLTQRFEHLPKPVYVLKHFFVFTLQF